jgi:DNA polymerase IV
LSCSVGVAANKYVAKVASDLKKPNGLVVVPPGEERAFLDPLPLERLWGVGPKTAEQLHALGLVTIGDVARMGESTLTNKFGLVGEHVARLALGLDERPVERERENKSHGAERTLEHDISGEKRVRQELLPLIDEVAHGLRMAKLRAKGVRLKLKYADFHRVSREMQLAEPAQDAHTILQAIDSLLPRIDTNRAIRLVGVAATHLVDEDAPRQASLFGAPQEKSEKLGKTVDKIREKFGDDAVGLKGSHARDKFGDAPVAMRERFSASSPAPGLAPGSRVVVLDDDDGEPQ